MSVWSNYKQAKRASHGSFTAWAEDCLGCGVYIVAVIVLAALVVSLLWPELG